MSSDCTGIALFSKNVDYEKEKEETKERKRRKDYEKCVIIT
jgi:hypothetical protein